MSDLTVDFKNGRYVVSSGNVEYGRFSYEEEADQLIEELYAEFAMA